MMKEITSKVALNFGVEKDVIIAILKSIKERGHSDMRDIRCLSELGIPIIGYAKKDYFMVCTNPFPISVFDDAVRHKKSMLCVMGNLPYEYICKVLKQIISDYEISSIG